MKDELFEAIADIARPNNVVMPLAAIWLEKGLITPSGRKIRISEGLEVYVDNEGKLQDNADEWNAVVSSCHGTVYNTDLHFVVIMRDSLELKRIDL